MRASKVVVSLLAAAPVVIAAGDSLRVTLEPSVAPAHESASWAKLERTEGSAELELIAHLRHQPEQLITLEEEFWAVSNPESERYGKHLSQAEVTDIVAQPDSVIKTAAAFLREECGATDIKVGAHKDALLFRVTARRAESCLQTEIHTFQSTNGQATLHRTTQSYSVPAGVIGDSIQLISGLTRLPDLDAFGPRASEEQEHSEQKGADWPSDCTHCSQKVTPAVIAARYNLPVPSSSATGSNLAVSEFQGQVWDQKDLDTFAGNCKQSVTWNVTVNHENGTIAPGNKCKIPIIGTQACGEALLDIEYAKGIAGPAIPLTDIYASGYNLLKWSQSVEAIDDANKILVHSVSYGNDEAQQTGVDFMEQCNAGFMKIGVRGVSILFASGDQGVCGRSGCGFGSSVRFHPDFPAGSPYITSVGGTDFAVRSVIGDEKVWSSGGGGFSDTFPIPAYQASAVAAYKKRPDANLPPQSMWNNTGRGYPDISALGGPSNSYCISAGSFMMGIYGTSASCPVAAAIIARLNAKRLSANGAPLGFLNPWMYKNPQMFHDVMQGVNNDGQKNGFTAVEGWDAATGLGTPNFAEMVKAL